MSHWKWRTKKSKEETACCVLLPKQDLFRFVFLHRKGLTVSPFSAIGGKDLHHMLSCRNHVPHNGGIPNALAIEEHKAIRVCLNGDPGFSGSLLRF